MDNDQDYISLVAHTHIEITLIDPLTALEAFKLIGALEKEGIETTINASSRIIMCETDELEDVTKHLAELGLVEHIGLIKLISTFEPDFQRILVEFEEE